MGLFKSLKKGFKKIGKGFKSAFKSIGKGIKSAMAKIGKFMNKIGIVGQLALMFTPVGAMMSNMFAGIGKAASSVLGKVVGKAATMTTAGASATITSGSGLLGSTSALARGAGTVLKAAGNFAKAGHAAFKTITEGMTSFIGEFSKTALKKIPGMQTMMPKFLGSDVSDTFFGNNSAWSKVQGVVDENASKILSSFDEQIGHTDKILTADQKNLKIKAEAQQAKAATGSTYDVKGMRGVQEIDASGFNQTAFDDLGKKGFEGMQEIDASGFNQSAFKEATSKPFDVSTIEKQQSLLGRVTDKITESYDEWKGDRTFAEAAVDTGIETVQDKLKTIPDEIAGGLKTRLYQNVGLQAKPVAKHISIQRLCP